MKTRPSQASDQCPEAFRGFSAFIGVIFPCFQGKTFVTPNVETKPSTQFSRSEINKDYLPRLWLTQITRVVFLQLYISGFIFKKNTLFQFGLCVKFSPIFSKTGRQTFSGKNFFRESDCVRNRFNHRDFTFCVLCHSSVRLSAPTNR